LGDRRSLDDSSRNFTARRGRGQAPKLAPRRSVVKSKETGLASFFHHALLAWVGLSRQFGLAGSKIVPSRFD
jgi:hypothetical protein